MNNNRGVFFNVDLVTIFLYLALCTIGWFNIYSAVYNPESPGILDLGTNYGKQFIFILSAVILGIVILFLDTRFFNAFSPIFYGVTLLLLVLVLIIGRNVAGNQAWIPIGTFRLQPSEFAKFATCLLLARYLSSSTTRLQDLKTQVYAALIILIPLLLILLQPDVGSALTFTALIFVLYREGLSGYFLILEALSIALFVLTILFNKYYVLLGSVAFAGLLFYFLRRYRQALTTIVIGLLYSVIFIFSVDFVYNNVLQPHHKNRIDVILGKIDDPRGKGYNLNQSLIAIGSGGLTGKGYLQGTQTKYDFVPEQSTDFIFCTVGEEWGFVGSMLILILYCLIIWRILENASLGASNFEILFGLGIAVFFMSQIFINIGMNLGLMPITGIPLPFISYGGSSLIVDLCSVGILLNIAKINNTT